MRIGRLIIRWLTEEEYLDLKYPPTKEPEFIPGDTAEDVDIKVYDRSGVLCHIIAFTEAGVKYTREGGSGYQHTMDWGRVVGIMAEYNEFPSLLPELKAAHQRMLAIKKAREEYNEAPSQLRQVLPAAGQSATALLGTGESQVSTQCGDDTEASRVSRLLRSMGNWQEDQGSS